MKCCVVTVLQSLCGVRFELSVCFRLSFLFDVLIIEQ
jgi:hypothetical protein